MVDLKGKLTRAARTLLHNASEEARRLNRKTIGADILLLAILRWSEENKAHMVLECGLDYDFVREYAEKRAIAKTQDTEHEFIGGVLVRAFEEATQIGRRYIGPIELILSLFPSDDTDLREIYLKCEVNCSAVRESLLLMLGRDSNGSRL